MASELGPDGNVKMGSVFPDLDVTRPDPTDPEFRKKYEEAYEKQCPRFHGKVTIKVEATDDTYRQLLKARLSCGVNYLHRVQELIRIGSWTSQFFGEMVETLRAMEADCCELWSEEPKELIPWLEEIVVVCKMFERFTYIRVVNGVDPPQRLDLAMRNRLRAEATLWKFKNPK